jgi:hypothetical protein
MGFNCIVLFQKGQLITTIINTQIKKIDAHVLKVLKTNTTSTFSPSWLSLFLPFTIAFSCFRCFELCVCRGGSNRTCMYWRYVFKRNTKIQLKCIYIIWRVDYVFLSTYLILYLFMYTCSIFICLPLFTLFLHNYISSFIVSCCFVFNF